LRGTTIDRSEIMSATVHELQAQVLGHPAEDRARLVELLLASFEPKSTAQQAWVRLAQSRREDVRAGGVTMVPGDEALARVRARLLARPRRALIAIHPWS
jgi:hypothetical protein